MFKDYADQSRTMYKDLFLFGYYSHKGANPQAIELFRTLLPKSRTISSTGFYLMRPIRRPMI